METKWDQVIPTIVETMLPRFSDPKLCLGMIIDTRYNCYSEECCDDGEADLITLIFHRPSNYTKVFVRVTDFRPNEGDGFDPAHFMWGHKIEEEYKFEMHSDHDSCWRSDGLRILFKRYMYNRNKMEKRGCNIKNFSIFSSFFMFAGKPTYLLMDKVEVDREKRTGMLKVNKRLTLKEAVFYLSDEKE